MLEVRALTKRWGAGGPTAVGGVDLDLAAGEVLTIIGESGAGKSTLARMLAGLTAPTTGTVVLDGVHLPSERSAAERRRIQLVGQNLRAALNRRQTVAHALHQAARLHDPGVRGDERAERVGAALDAVGLHRDHLDRRPAALSGGELARVVLSRALLVQPRVLVLDEPTASLDARATLAVVDLVRRIAGEGGRGIVVITHEVPVARRIADRAAVMDGGVLVECGPAATVLTTPAHPRTRALLDAVLTLPPPGPPADRAGPPVVGDPDRVRGAATTR